MSFSKVLCLILVGGCLVILSCSKSVTKVKSYETTRQNKVEDIDAIKADSLLALMTISEKLGQLQQLDGGISKKDLPLLIAQGRVGSVLNEVDQNLVRKYQKIAIEKSRLGIPLLIGRDVVHGFRTMFPIPLAQSASWNTDLAYQGSQIAAKEASSVGINWTFAPMIDVTRDPRWGRIAESPGEDPYLTTEMGVAMIRGFQGNGKYHDGNMAACAKHFAAYGMAEGGRDYNSAIVGKRQLNEVYFRPFKAAVENGAMSFMTSFNEINDVPASGNQYLLKEILRDQWQYDGMVVSDWESIIEMIAHGYCKDEKEAAYKAMRAGVDMEMTSTSYNDFLQVLIDEDRISVQQLNSAVRRILLMKIRLGLFSNPYPIIKNQNSVLSKEHLESARQAAEEGIVMLKNENSILPLSDQITSVAVIGPLANAPHEQLGTWSFDGKKSDAQTPLAALKKHFSNAVNVNYALGLKISRTKDHNGFEEAISAAKNSDVVLYFVGEEAILSGEAHSRAHLNLPGAQETLLEELNKTGKPIIMIVMAGRPLILTDLLPKVDAVLYAWHGGTMAGPAITDILTGKANPSGKLPVTFPRAVGQIPVYHAHKNTGRPASPDKWTPIDKIAVEAWQTSLGNTSHYLDEGYTPLFPFGYGLSYSNFIYENLRLNQNQMNNSEVIIAQVDIINRSEFDGKEVVQLYLQDRFASITRPVKELKGFQKIFLKAGETKTVTFEISNEELSFFDENNNYTSEAGKFNVWIGGHSDTKKSVMFELVEQNHRLKNE